MSLQTTEVFDVGIAVDELVCAICGTDLTGKRFGIISDKARRGIFLFTCEAHPTEAADWLSNAIGKPICHHNVKLPPSPSVN